MTLAIKSTLIDLLRFFKEEGMTQLVVLLLLIHFTIAYQCFRYANEKGYPVKVFTCLGLVPYFNLVVWIYLLFLPELEPFESHAHEHKQPL
jgi:hypothetical protein